MDDLLDSLIDRTPRTIDHPPATAVIARVDVDGTWVTIPGDDPRQPYGPCRGGSRDDGTGTIVPDAGMTVGTNVLLVWTADGPWIAAREHLEP